MAPMVAAYLSEAPMVDVARDQRWGRVAEGARTVLRKGSSRLPAPGATLVRYLNFLLWQTVHSPAKTEIFWQGSKIHHGL